MHKELWTYEQPLIENNHFGYRVFNWATSRVLGHDKCDPNPVFLNKEACERFIQKNKVLGARPKPVKLLTGV